VGGEVGRSGAALGRNSTSLLSGKTSAPRQELFIRRPHGSLRPGKRQETGHRATALVDGLEAVGYVLDTFI
jgi:hypothetical protein